MDGLDFSQNPQMTMPGSAEFTSVQFSRLCFCNGRVEATKKRSKLAKKY
jgi:hypothetical protein